MMTYQTYRDPMPLQNGFKTDEEKLTTELNQYFNNKVQLCREEKTMAYQTVMPVVEQLVKYVHKQDPRFGAEVIKVGSSFQGLKVGEPNEYDVNIPLMGMEQYCWVPQKPRYYDIAKPTNGQIGPELPPYHGILSKPGSCREVDEVIIYRCDKEKTTSPPYTFVPTNSKEARWVNSEDLDFDGDLIPILIKKCFKKLLIEGVRELNLRKHVIVDKRFHGPAIMLKFRNHDMTVDMSVVIDRAATFPDYAGWPHRNTSWPTVEKKQMVSNIGVSFVTKKDLIWMVSPALAEREIMKGIDADEGCRKMCHRIMKKLNEDLWSKNTKAISSYALKNLLLWECECLPNTRDWLKPMMRQRIIQMTEKLLQHVQTGELKVFFVPQRNILLKESDKDKMDLQEAGRRIAQFLQEPLIFLNHLNEN